MNKGFSIIEIILASAMFVIFATSGAVAIIQSFNANRLGQEMSVANQFAAEGIEAVRSIKNQGFQNLVNSAGTGVRRSVSNVWEFNGTNNTLFHNSGDNYIRVINIADTQRDASGNIVVSGGTPDPYTKKITSTVTWKFNSARPESVALIAYLTKWRAVIGKGGMLVYGDGGTATDAIKYRTLDGDLNTWSAPAATADVDTGTTNKALRSARIYTSATRNEKVLISRHYNGSTQFIYAQVYNGTSWGNVVLLSSWSATTFLDVQNFDGTYLTNGNFMAVYSDNTRTPKSRIWTGMAWQAETSLTRISANQIPVYIVIKARPGTNEIMGAFFSDGLETVTEYYSGSSWSGTTSHSTSAPANTIRFIDFDWSPNSPTFGALVYPTSSSVRSIRVRIWQADGSGGGSWGTAVAAAVQTNYPRAVSIAGRNTANEFQMCDKDAAVTPTIICYKVTFVNRVATIANPTNQTIAAATDTGIERSFRTDFETNSGALGLAVYSDNTNIPKLKKYNPGTSSWDGSATSISTGSYTLGTVKAVRLIAQDSGIGDDMIALIADGNLDLYSVVWNGTTDSMYTTNGQTFTQHGINGSAATDFWFDFVWDKL